MKSRHFDHIDLRVRNVERAQKFYVPLLNALGFTVDQRIKNWVSYEASRKGGKPQGERWKPSPQITPMSRIVKPFSTACLLILIQAISL